MRIAIALHSTSGNTKLVTRYAASYLQAAGHECEIFDIVKRKEPPSFDEFDVLCISCPTMYFRPTFAMERYIARMETAAKGPKPAFLLATCMGEPGAHFSLVAEWLLMKDYVTVSAKWVLAPSNWPTHISAMKSLETSTPVGTWLCHLSRPLRPVWGTIWPYSTLPDEGDRRELEQYLDETMRLVEAGHLEDVPTPNKLHRPYPGCHVSGRIFAREHLETISLTIDASRCSKCGTCVLVCPVNIVHRASDDEIPSFRFGCSGCFACFNRCPDGAIGCIATPIGAGQYKGPPPAMREVFRPLKGTRTEA